MENMENTFTQLEPEHKCIVDLVDEGHKIACQLCNWESTATEAKFVKDIVDNHNVLNGYWPFREAPPLGWGA